MKKVINLEDLLKHSILNLYSAEVQLIEAIPAMIEKATNPSLKEALDNHLHVTERQKDRLDKIKTVLMGKATIEEKGFFSKIFGIDDIAFSKGIEGIIKEAEAIMKIDISAETMDAAIIGAAQKVEHYEIAAYGTACSYAEELNLEFVAEELVKSLQEEWDADAALTVLAKDDINIESEMAGDEIYMSDASVEDAGEDDELPVQTTQSDFAKPDVDHLATSPIAEVNQNNSSL